MKSENFEFLRPFDATLADLGLMAERYMWTDSPSAAVKLRIFAERVVLKSYSFLGYETPARPELLALIDDPRFRRHVPRELVSKFHDLRIQGNRAAHDHEEVPVGRFCQLLRGAFELGRWFIREFHGASPDSSVKFHDPQTPSGKPTSTTPTSSYTCPIPGCGYEFKTGRLGWDSHIGSSTLHREWQPAVKNSAQRKEIFRRTFPEFFQGLTATDAEPESTGHRCPIPGCNMSFKIGRLGWDAHVGAKRKHANWHPGVQDSERRKALFKAEFAHWFVD